MHAIHHRYANIDGQQLFYGKRGQPPHRHPRDQQTPGRSAAKPGDRQQHPPYSAV